MNTDYGMREPERKELLEAFGTLERCVEITGGDLPTILFYLHNRERIAGAAATKHKATDGYAMSLRREVDREREAKEARDASEALRASETKTVTAVAETLGVSRTTARRRLVRARAWPLSPQP